MEASARGTCLMQPRSQHQAALWEPGGRSVLNMVIQLPGPILFCQEPRLGFAFKSTGADKISCARGLVLLGLWASLLPARGTGRGGTGAPSLRWLTPSRYMKSFNMPFLERAGVFMALFPHIRTSSNDTKEAAEEVPGSWALAGG